MDYCDEKAVDLISSALPEALLDVEAHDDYRSELAGAFCILPALKIGGVPYWRDPFDWEGPIELQRENVEVGTLRGRS